MTREEMLLQSGWKKEGTFDEPRLTEVVELYREIGFEVFAKPAFLAEVNGCAECMKPDLGRFKTVYVRKINCVASRSESHSFTDADSPGRDSCRVDPVSDI